MIARGPSPSLEASPGANDCHSHFALPEVFELVRGREARFGVSFEDGDGERRLGPRSYVHGRPLALEPPFWRLDDCVAAADVTVSVLSPPTFFFHYVLSGADRSCAPDTFANRFIDNRRSGLLFEPLCFGFDRPPSVRRVAWRSSNHGAGYVHEGRARR